MCIVVYFSICALVYVSDGIWIGSAVILATAIWFCAATIRAFQSRDSFILGLSVVGSFCLISCLGITVETSTPMGMLEDARSSTWNMLSGGRKFPEIESYVGLKRSHYHDLFHSSAMVRVPNQHFVPSRRNAIVLVVCLWSLAMGIFGGCLFKFISGYRKDRGSDEQARDNQ